MNDTTYTLHITAETAAAAAALWRHALEAGHERIRIAATDGDGDRPARPAELQEILDRVAAGDG